MELTLREAIRTTGSVRAFTDETVTDAQLHAVLDNARFAPSGGNKQGWQVIVLRDPAIRAEAMRLAEEGWREYGGLTEAGYRPFAADETGIWPGVPSHLSLEQLAAQPRPFPLADGLTDGVALLVVCADLRVIADVDIDSTRTKIAAGGSLYPFVWNLLLSARAEGMGGVMTTMLIRRQEQARVLLGIPDSFGIASMVFIGHPVHQNTRLRRKQVAEFTTIDRFDGQTLAPDAGT